MKHLVALLAILFLGTSVAPAGSPEAGMEKLKSLVGVWEGKDKDGKPIQVSYKLVSGGSSLMETIDMGEHKDGMITVYHVDGDHVMMTHYCSMGNQPRMRVSGSSDASLKFTYVDGTNMSEDDPHMHQLVISWKDKDHIAQEWTMRSKGEDTPPVVFNLERKV